jgi:hypothetical protein
LVIADLVHLKAKVIAASAKSVPGDARRCFRAHDCEVGRLDGAIVTNNTKPYG